MKRIIFAFVAVVILFTTSCQKESVENTRVLVLQPDSINGKDALIWSSLPDNNSGRYIDFQVMAWTWYALGLPMGVRRSLIDFDLSSVPDNVTITHASLSLYHHPNTPEPIGGHSQISGLNNCFLQRITENWDEMSVTWNNQPATTQENQVVLEESQAFDQSYTDIDVTVLLQDMISKPDSSFGFMLKLQTEEYYRAMIFASSDSENPELYPKLVIEYQ
jgi:hypothetical protein